MSVLQPYKNQSALVSSIWKLLESIADPEIPVLSIIDLGILRSIQLKENGVIDIIITPTYTGCPAMDAISLDIRIKLLENGYTNFKVSSLLSPAWTTDWMTEEGKLKLKTYGIAPPGPKAQICGSDLFSEEESVQCPQCKSHHTVILSRFGSTACKALYQCQNCREPFDYFKCH